jgi:hypothetical protein
VLDHGGVRALRCGQSTLEPLEVIQLGWNTQRSSSDIASDTWDNVIDTKLRWRYALDDIHNAAWRAVYLAVVPGTWVEHWDAARYKIYVEIYTCDEPPHLPVARHGANARGVTEFRQLRIMGGSVPMRCVSLAVWWSLASGTNLVGVWWRARKGDAVAVQANRQWLELDSAAGVDAAGCWGVDAAVGVVVG